MSPLNSIKANCIVYLAFFLLFAVSCSSHDSSNCLNCADKHPLSPNAEFRITDKLTNEDLFFGMPSRFNLNQLKVHHIVNGKADTAVLKIDSVKRIFSVNIHYQGNVDTLSLQIGNLKPDYLYLTNDVSNQCCLHIYVTSASFNGSVIYTDPKQTYTVKDTAASKVINILK